VTPVEALQAALAGEHAATYVYSTLGGRISTSDHPVLAERLRAAYEVHRGRRDHLRSLVAATGATPEPPAAAYLVDADDRDARSLSRVAVTTEQRCAEVYGQLVASTSGDQRRWAIEALTDAALRGLDLGDSPSAYPGLPELS
jgi:hypothetical protein